MHIEIFRSGWIIAQIWIIITTTTKILLNKITDSKFYFIFAFWLGWEPIRKAIGLQSSRHIGWSCTYWPLFDGTNNNDKCKYLEIIDKIRHCRFYFFIEFLLLLMRSSEFCTRDACFCEINIGPQRQKKSGNQKKRKKNERQNKGNGLVKLCF